MKTATLVIGALAFFVGSMLYANHVGSTIDVSKTMLVNEEDYTMSDSEVSFNKMMDVLTSKRCVNCHPNDKIPKQGDDSHPHFFGISGGIENIGYESTTCGTCHQEENNDYSGVPGAPEWSLAPDAMKWEGLSRIEIAKSILDPAINGGRNLEELEHHLTAHELVLWAWEPGIRADGSKREPPPVPLEEYIQAVKHWIEEGAVIPEN